MSDGYFTILKQGEGTLREKMSRFLAFALPVSSAEEAKAIIKDYQNEYHNSRHVCWAYMLGPTRMEWQLNDNGEPSGTAGKPILGQINSRNLTDVLVIVVRYFGGIKLGTPGLIAAYREAASLALDDAGVREMFCMEEIDIRFAYEDADTVMKVVKGCALEIVSRTFDNICTMHLRFRQSIAPEVKEKLKNFIQK